ncbi:triose-phosphate isomerase [Candidatus Woesebacteria bacterium]|jgi:triosephosphate isomerase|nr:triose-phosphate isomerase [Candidatus Woesebacteria bacterium]
MIFVNFKTYKESTAKGAESLLSVIKNLRSKTSVPIIPVLSSLDSGLVSAFNLPVWVQHIDPEVYGSHTGYTLAEHAKAVGFEGTFLNHSEHRFSTFENLTKAHELAKAASLKTLIFAGDITQLELVLTLHPDYVSYEPPELVGSTEASVSGTHPEVIKNAAMLCANQNVPLIIGAGIHSTEDVRVGVELGAKGVAVATFVVKSENPEESLNFLLNGFSS